MTTRSAPGARTGAKSFEGGEAIPQGAENSALKNTAPFNATPPRISENASIVVLSGLAAKALGLAANRSVQSGLPVKLSVRPGMGEREESEQNSIRSRDNPQ